MYSQKTGGQKANSNLHKGIAIIYTIYIIPNVKVRR